MWREWSSQVTRAGFMWAALVIAGAFSPVVATTADDLCAPNDDPCTVSTTVMVSDRSSINLGSRALVVAVGGRLDVSGGSMTVAARVVTIEEGGQLLADGSGAQGGTLNVGAQEIAVAGVVRANGTNGGSVSLAAAATLSVTGSITVNGTTGSGSGGELELTGTDLSVFGDLSATGRADGLGGSIVLTADQNIVIDSSVNASAGDAGDITVVAGGLSGGNLQLLAGAALAVNGSSFGGSGGSIDLTAQGDGVETGHVTLDGTAEARGASGGGDGGDISVTAAGNLTGAAGSGAYDASAGPPDGLAGAISLVALGSIDLQRRLSAQGSGTEGIGGDIGVDAGVDLNVGTKLTVTGADDGGSIGLRVNRGRLTVLPGSVAGIDASGSVGGDGGEVEMSGTAASSSVVIMGKVSANGAGFGSVPGNGGRIEITAAGTLSVGGPLPMADGVLQALGGNGGGSGGTVMLNTTRGDLQVAGTVSAAGLGRLSHGGVVALSSGNSLLVSGLLDATGDREGGQIGLEASGFVTLDGRVEAAGLSPADGSGGHIEVRSDQDARIGGTLGVDGRGTGAAQAGDIGIEACTVTIEPEAVLSAAGNHGRNRLVGHHRVTVAGTMLADRDSGVNEIVYRDPQNPPDILPSANIVPLPTSTENQELSRCPEPVGLCDVDGDGSADASDLEWLARELFDGDGDRVEDVRSGTFAGTEGADANMDGRITSADLTRCVQLVEGSSVRF